MKQANRSQDVSAKPDVPTSGLGRLDVALVERGLAATRARARDAILRGHVTVDGLRAEKPALAVPANAAITVDDPAGPYVSRAALKLVAALDHFGYDPAGRIALDIGASTGGFTQVLLARGAARVFAIDVGHGQLHPSLAAEPRVVKREGLNARNLDLRDVDGTPVGAIVADVSFISLKYILQPACALAAPDGWGVFLVKPQFEVGPEHLGKTGIVRDPAVARRAAEDLVAWLKAAGGWTVDGLIASPIRGGEGNREYLIGARRA